MNFSLFLNSRGRVHQLNRFIETVERVTSNKKEVEVIITGDDDDQPTVDYLMGAVGNKSISIRPIIGPRPKSLCASYNNMARQANGRYLFVMNDDSEIQTFGWDDMALVRISQWQKENGFKDDIVYVSTDDNSIDKVKGKKYASFPIISAEAIKTLGFFMYEDFVGLGGDSSIYRVYEAVNRVVLAPEIKIDHVYHNTFERVVSPDLTAYEMRANSATFNLDPFTFNVDKEVAKLSDFIKAKNQ